MAKRRCKTDWFRLLSDLKRFGYSHNDIFKRTCIPIGTISGYKQGSEPKHADGERLISLWCEVTGKSRKDLPVLNSNCWWSYHL